PAHSRAIKRQFFARVINSPYRSSHSRRPARYGFSLCEVARSTVSCLGCDASAATGSQSAGAVGFDTTESCVLWVILFIPRLQPHYSSGVAAPVVLRPRVGAPLWRSHLS